MEKFFELFERFSGNPIIRPEDMPYPVNTVFNAGAARVGEDILLLLRVEDHRGLSHLTVARSRNGLDGWKIEAQPSLLPDPANYPEELWGIEDPRITHLEEKDCWAVTYTAYSRSGPLVSLALTEDFKSFTRLGAVLPPENKDAVLFPVRFKGDWLMLHRPVPATPGVGAHIWMAASPDLRHWGEHRVLLPARQGGWWDANKIGACAPPLPTDEGWLLLYHGVKNTVSGCVYRLGLALLDLEDPRRILARSRQWVMAPKKDYEMVGEVAEVIFPCGWVRQGGRVILYYGCADNCLASARAELNELLGWLKADSAGEDE